jgi:hypothetical protein
MKDRDYASDLDAKVAALVEEYVIKSDEIYKSVMERL